MSFLTGKTILIISPQDWGTMRISKHHYALELAKRGNRVYYLNPPDQQGKMEKGAIQIDLLAGHRGMNIVRHRLFFPYWLKFKAMPVFHWLIRYQVKKILHCLEEEPDIVWSFDIGNLYPFSCFPEKAVKIFHPVDEPLQPEAIRAAQGAAVIFSVTREILDKYQQFPVPKQFFHHGVSQDFLDALDLSSPKKNGAPRVGYAGNLLRDDMDRPTLLAIVQQHPEIEFHFFGSYELKQTNIGGTENEESRSFIDQLKSFAQVKLHGVLGQEKLAKAFAGIDAFLVCYDINKDQSKGTNYHKLMEYLATGKVIIANNITTFSKEPGLIRMTDSRTNNQQLPALFTTVMDNLSFENNAANMKYRRDFAIQNTYQHQLQRIEQALESLAVTAVPA